MPVVLRDVPPSAQLNREFVALVELRYPDRLDYSVLTSGQDFDLVEGQKRIGRARLHSPRGDGG